MEKMKVEITLIEDMLGTLPGDSEIFKNFVAKKAEKTQPDFMKSEKLEEELATLKPMDAEEAYEKGCTIFAKLEDGTPFIYDYLIKGFFKNACKALREDKKSASSKLSAYKTKIDNLVFVGPRKILFEMEENAKISICERPLRASTPQGERVALAASESVPAGTKMTFEITTLNEDMMKLVPDWLDYGQFNGLGQWHNSGKGRFTWKLVD